MSEAPIYAVWLARDVLGATGPDAASFLQGQLSQDLDAVPVGASAWSWLLAPTGKVDALLRVARRGDNDWILDTDAGWGETVLTRLNRFRLRTKVDLVVRPWTVLGIRGPGAADVVPAGGVESVVDAWPALSGVDHLGPSPEIPAGLELVDAETYEATRIRAGIPRMGAELTDRTIPAETGLIDLTVSFTKGCYTGQELVARIDSRGGHVPRHLRGLRMADRLEPGTDLEADGKPVGTVTSVAPTPEGTWVGLAYVRRGYDPPLTLSAPGHPSVEVLELGR